MLGGRGQLYSHPCALLVQRAEGGYVVPILPWTGCPINFFQAFVRVCVHGRHVQTVILFDLASLPGGREHT